jgi:SAM-dependent methyltransferase
MQPLLQDAEYYAKCYSEFTQKSTTLNQRLQWCELHLLSILRCTTSKVYVLSVGCGTGDFDVKVMAILQKKYPFLHYTGIEPNAPNREQFFKNFNNSSIDTHNINLELIDGTIENFIPADSERKYNLVLLSHCLYNILERKKIIQKSLEMVSDDGVLVIINYTPAGINHVQRAMLDLLEVPREQVFSSRDIEDLLEEMDGVNYHIEMTNGYIDVTQCFDQTSTEGLMMLNFLVESDLRDAPSEERNMIIRFLDSICLTRKNHRLLFHPQAIFILRRDTGSGK